MINIINQADRNSSILDIGCEGSPVLPLLRRLGFKESVWLRFSPQQEI